MDLLIRRFSYTKVAYHKINDLFLICCIYKTGDSFVIIL